MRGAATTVAEVAAMSASGGKLGWWYVRFRLNWPEGEEPLWYPDLLLADRVVGPVLDTRRAEIPLWRFHRRAARDGAGRQFSFIFRATPATAASVNARIAADPLVVRLQGDGLVQAVVYDDPGAVRRPGIGDTSDKNWSPEMQTAWPITTMKCAIGHTREKRVNKADAVRAMAKSNHRHQVSTWCCRCNFPKSVFC